MPFLNFALAFRFTQSLQCYVVPFSFLNLNGIMLTETKIKEGKNSTGRTRL